MNGVYLNFTETQTNFRLPVHTTLNNKIQMLRLYFNIDLMIEYGCKHLYILIINIVITICNDFAYLQHDLHYELTATMKRTIFTQIFTDSLANFLPPLVRNPCSFAENDKYVLSP